MQLDHNVSHYLNGRGFYHFECRVQLVLKLIKFYVRIRIDADHADAQIEILLKYLRF